MNVNLLQGPGSGSDAAGGAAGDANAALARHRAWQSAMEQAQMANWFKPGGDASGNASHVAPARTPTAALIRRIAPDFSASPAAGDEAPQDSPTRAAQETSARAARLTPAKAPSAASLEDAQPRHGQEEAPPREGAPPRGSSALASPAGPQPQRSAAPSLADAPPLSLDAAPSPSPIALAPSPARIGSDSATTVAPQQPPSARIESFSLRSVASQIAQWLDGPEIEATENTPAADAPSPRRSEQEASDGATRLHVEWTREGARLWLGVDHDQLQRVPTLIGQLQQWLASSGVKLLALVCNGRTVYLARRAPPPSFPSQGDLA